MQATTRWAVVAANLALLAVAVSPERRGAVLGQVLFPFCVSGLTGPLIGGALRGADRRPVMPTAAVASVPAALPR